MATILPNNPVGSISAVTLRVFRWLKRLPASFTIWQRLSGGNPSAGPDFWLCHADGRCALLTVACVSRDDLKRAGQHALFAAPITQPCASEEAAIAAFWLTLPANIPVPSTLLPGLILVPLVPQQELATTLAPPPSGMIRVGKEEAAPERLLPWLEAHLGPPLNAAQIEALRYAFTPEVVVPAQLTVRKPLERSVAAQLTSYLLSYDQERILKHDLDLSAEAEATTDNMHLQLVNGIAGSGKSLILLYRARLLRQFFPRKRILVLTHNRPLIRDLERRYLLLTNDDRRVKWFTFHGWCCYYWFKQDPKYKIIKTFERQKLIQQAWQKHLVDTAISPKMIESEIDWLKDRLITTREAYIEADRAGRGFALKEAMRSRVYDAIHTYQALLQEKNQLDFGDVPRRIWRLLHENAAAIPSYDVILIDEAQFFAPIWFSIIKQILRPPHGHLFMVADPTQGFLKRRQSWLASGLNVRGQSQRLEQCYRTTREILSFASRFYQQRLPDDDEAIVGVKLQQTPSGLMPEVIALRSEQDETARVINEIRALVAAKVPLDQILIIHANWQGADRLLTRLKTLLGAEQVVHPRDGTGTNQLRVCQLDAVTGLESPIVFLVGCHRILEAEDNPRLSAEERAEQLRDNTRRLYMAMTRAGQRLVVTYVGAVPPCMT